MPAMSPDALAFNELVSAVFRLSGLALAAGDRLSRPAGLTSSRWQVLGVVDHGPATVATVARTMGLTRQTVRLVAAGLARAGFVEPVANPHHRTARLIRITDAGVKALRKVEARHATWAHRLGAAIDRRQLGAALRGLELARQVLENDARRASRKG